MIINQWNLITFNISYWHSNELYQQQKKEEVHQEVSGGFSYYDIQWVDYLERFKLIKNLISV